MPISFMWYIIGKLCVHLFILFSSYAPPFTFILSKDPVKGSFGSRFLLFIWSCNVCTLHCYTMLYALWTNFKISYYKTVCKLEIQIKEGPTNKWIHLIFINDDSLLFTHTHLLINWIGYDVKAIANWRFWENFYAIESCWDDYTIEKVDKNSVCPSLILLLFN